MVKIGFCDTFASPSTGTISNYHSLSLYLFPKVAAGEGRDFGARAVLHHRGGAEHVRRGVRGAVAHRGDHPDVPAADQVKAPPPLQLRQLRG